jgi:hypothetical protein
MARTAATLQKNEMEAFQKFAAEHGIKLDGEEGVRNGDILGGAIISANQDITPTTLAAAFEQVRDKLTLKSAAEREYDSVSAESPAAAAQFDVWFQNQKQLINTGDEGFQNASGLLRELRGREITNQTIAAAMERIGAPVSRFHAARRPLHYVQSSKPFVNPKSHAHPDRLVPNESKPGPQFVGGRKNHATDPVETQVQTKPARQIDAWETIARNHLGAGQTHSQRAALQEIYDLASNGALSWREAGAKMGDLKKSFQLVRF